MLLARVINGEKNEKVNVAQVESTGQAVPTNRVLEYYIAAEYQEPGVMPDGRKCLKIYQFTDDEIVDATIDGNGDTNYSWEEFLPWDDAHVDHVVIC